MVGPEEKWAAASTARVTVATNLCFGTRYTFTFKDSYGDGVCCAFGRGAYALWLGDLAVFRSQGNFGASEATTFVPGETTALPSPRPVPAPTPQPSPRPVQRSAKTCAQLGWANGETYGDANVRGGFACQY